jgi:hypothetical protein
MESLQAGTLSKTTPTGGVGQSRSMAVREQSGDRFDGCSHAQHIH